METLQERFFIVGLSFLIHSRLFAAVSFIKTKTDSLDCWRAKAALCRLYVVSSIIRPASTDQLWLSAHFPLRAGVENSSPVRVDRGTLRIFLNRFFRAFVHELCITPISEKRGKDGWRGWRGWKKGKEVFPWHRHTRHSGIEKQVEA